jgi:hypothetical protein
MAAPRSARDRGPVLCEYFYKCERVAGGTIVHALAGEVPICVECALLAGLDLQPSLLAQANAAGPEDTPVIRGTLGTSGP